ncbi:MAG: hypothetical protein KA098_00080 [Phenylobacterium sp.]|nr:hypothetical protein [Phenylobacterium sp.]
MWRDEGGNVAILTALSAGLLGAAAGFGVEVGYWHLLQARLQQAADAAAYAGAVDLRTGVGADPQASALAAATANRFDPAKGGIDTVWPSITFPSDPNSVDVSLSRSEPRVFTALFIDEPVLIRVHATASFQTAGKACVLALDPSASRAAQFSGNSNTKLVGCVVSANSLAADAVRVQGSAQLSTPCIYSSGGVELTTGAHLDCAAAKVGQALTPDPYRNLTVPSPTGPCTGNSSNIQPGRCFSNLQLNKGVTHFPPGNYFISGGSMTVNANASITGTGVTFFFINNASVDLRGGAQVDLAAPTSGPYSGMLLVGARTNTDVENKINGDASSRLTGAIYFPKQRVTYNGNFSGDNGCVQVVAKTVEWSGSTTVKVDCSAYGMGVIETGGAAKLVR